MHILMIADVVGNPGRRIVCDLLPILRRRLSLDFVIVNAENAAGGMGMTAAIGQEILSWGADCITMGNHVWDKKDLIELLPNEPRILRPANYPPDVPGAGVYLTERRGTKIAVISLVGRVFMGNFDCPFRRAQEEIESLGDGVRVIVVDIHAEATSEKIALGCFLDGKVSAVLGTHTHVSTTDFRILPQGTAYATDLGMTGPVDSVIGIKKDLIIRRFLTQMPVKYDVGGGASQLEGALLKVGEDGRARSIERILEIREAS